jgi:hypothetical protein
MPARVLHSVSFLGHLLPAEVPFRKRGLVHGPTSFCKKHEMKANRVKRKQTGENESKQSEPKANKGKRKQTKGNESKQRETRVIESEKRKKT